ncbi:ras-related protein Rab-20 isoform X1 [Bos javanicus]|uniref:ras-related protein Rab-20 isoform X1 n=1 Tax=Bos javanicus TaxID=9906 RepID=UPI002AA6AAC2|nr:ras-related protein Rab-20 isoform X1 [Bos javanicus]
MEGGRGTPEIGGWGSQWAVTKGRVRACGAEAGQGRCSSGDTPSHPASRPHFRAPAPPSSENPDGGASANTAPGVHTGAPPASPVKTRSAQLPKSDVHSEVKWRRRSSSRSDLQQHNPLLAKVSENDIRQGPGRQAEDRSSRTSRPHLRLRRRKPGAGAAARPAPGRLGQQPGRAPALCPPRDSALRPPAFPPGAPTCPAPPPQPARVFRVPPAGGTSAEPARRQVHPAWRAAGREQFHGLGSMYCRGAAAVILTYDVNHAQSLLELENRFLGLTDTASADCLFAVVGNKVDLSEEAPGEGGQGGGRDPGQAGGGSGSSKQVQLEDAMAFYKKILKYKMLDEKDVPAAEQMCFETSAKTGKNVDLLFETVFDMVVPVILRQRAQAPPQTVDIVSAPPPARTRSGCCS